MSTKVKKSRGQAELAAAIRFFIGKTKRGAKWLRVKRANRTTYLRAIVKAEGDRA